MAWYQPSSAVLDDSPSRKIAFEPAWGYPYQQGSSAAVSSSNPDRARVDSVMDWDFAFSEYKRHQSQSLCNLCSDRSDKLSLHASHGFWPLATQSTIETTIDLDELLESNKDTVESITGILDCSCSENVLLFEKCSTNVGRIIDWYTEAYSGHDRIIPTTVYIGSYFVNPVTSRDQTTTLVLSEMHSLLVPLLDRIEAVYNRHESLHSGRGAGLRDPRSHRTRVLSFFHSAHQRLHTF